MRAVSNCVVDRNPKLQMVHSEHLPICSEFLCSSSAHLSIRSSEKIALHKQNINFILTFFASSLSFRLFPGTRELSMVINSYRWSFPIEGRHITYTETTTNWLIILLFCPIQSPTSHLVGVERSEQRQQQRHHHKRCSEVIKVSSKQSHGPWLRECKWKSPKNKPFNMMKY